MVSKKNPKRDIRVLMKMLEFIDELREGIQKYAIKQPSDLSATKLDKLVRRGIIHVISEFTEAEDKITDTTLRQLSLNMTLLRPFRNAVIHRYETVTDTMIFALMAYCTSNETTGSIKAVLMSLQ